MENWLSVIVGVYLAAMIFYGYRRGLVRLAVSLLALVATLVIVNVMMPVVTDTLKRNTTIYQTLEEKLKLTVGMEQKAEDEDPAGEVQPPTQRMIIDNLKLPESIKDTLLENNNNQVYQMLGVEGFRDYISSYLTNIIVNAIAFILTFVVVSIAIRLLLSWLDLVAKLPIISGINKIAGALLGAAEALMILWVAALVVTACAGTDWGIALIGQINASPWLSFLYNNNLLNSFILGIASIAF